MRLFPVLGDQLSHALASLREARAGEDVVLMMEVAEEATYVPHHPKKITLILSAMRHFAEELRAKGFEVRYIRLDDPSNAGSFFGEVQRACTQIGAEEVVATWPGEYRVLKDMQAWEADLGLPVRIVEDDRFVCTTAEFEGWAEGRKSLRMEFFYREMRRKTGLLMDGDKPVGGQWNFDADNRKKMPKDVVPSAALGIEPDAVTLKVMALVKQRFDNHFGDLEGFDFPVTRAQALRALNLFIAERLPRFGDFQDAMRRPTGAESDDTLFHSILAPALNIGLLEPLEICQAAEQAYRDGHAPLNAVEGFIRQVIGWREFVRGIYWMTMPGYAETNTFEAKRALPDFFWTGETDMDCVAHAVDQTKRTAYAHHIQRLMVTGNLALIAGCAPDAVNQWYLSVYADAFEWVQLPNTHGMVLHADGGYLGSKPYAASGKYIDRMSNYCRDCRYAVKNTLEDDACPFNALYWNFIIENKDKLSGNPRMGLVYRSLAKFDDARQEALQAKARATLHNWGLTA